MFYSLVKDSKGYKVASTTTASSARKGFSTLEEAEEAIKIIKSCEALVNIAKRVIETGSFQERVGKAATKEAQKGETKRALHDIRR